MRKNNTIWRILKLSTFCPFDICTFKFSTIIVVIEIYCSIFILIIFSRFLLMVWSSCHINQMWKKWRKEKSPTWLLVINWIIGSDWRINRLSQLHHLKFIRNILLNPFLFSLFHFFTHGVLVGSPLFLSFDESTY
jgi:hypothetical protein